MTLSDMTGNDSLPGQQLMSTFFILDGAANDPD